MTREARDFLDALHVYFKFDSSYHVLDLACGKGRHARYLHGLGPEVTGLDLSPSSVDHANQYASAGLSFQVQDMRIPFGYECYDFVLNLFTSFGYFELEQDHQRVINNIAASLKNGGKVLIDYMNPYYMLRHLQPFELKGIGDASFEIRREVNMGYVIKYINVKSQGKNYHYQEKVKLLFPEDFETYFERAGLRLVETFGDYKLGSFAKNISPRLVLLAEKFI